MIERCRDAGIPEPDFEQRADQFVVTIWRDWLTADVQAAMELNDRQKEAIIYLKVHQQMANVDYQRVAKSPPRTATRDLNLLVGRGIVELRGKGRGAHYVLLKKHARNAPNTPTGVEE